MKTPPVGTEISQLQSDHSWFLFFLTSQNRIPCFFVEGLQHGAEASALAEQEPKPERARAFDNVIETAWKNSIETTLKFEPGISGLRGCAATHLGRDKFREIFERLSFTNFHFSAGSRQCIVHRPMGSQVNWRKIAIKLAIQPAVCRANAVPNRAS